HARVAIRPHVSIGGVRVGWLDERAAATAVQRSFARPLTVVVDGAKMRLHPTKLATPYVDGAVKRAWNAPAGTDVDLLVTVRGASVRAVVARLARRFDRTQSSARVTLDAGRPRFTRDHVGHHLDKGVLVAAVVHALATNHRAALRFHTTTLEPKVTRR